MRENTNLKILAQKLREIFHGVYERLKGKVLTDRTLDKEVLSILRSFEVSDNELELKFSEPKDSIYRAEAGRTPYDLLCSGTVNGKKFVVFINNKFGNLFGNARNDITTYNNLLRLYLGISRQRLTSKITIDGDLIYRRVSGEEIVSYAVFVVDNKNRGSRFFLLEEIKDGFYVNPRNAMFQVKYDPQICDPTDYYTFCVNLIEAIFKALEKAINTLKTEIIVLAKIKEELISIKGRMGDE